MRAAEEERCLYRISAYRPRQALPVWEETLMCWQSLLFLNKTRHRRRYHAVALISQGGADILEAYKGSCWFKPVWQFYMRARIQRCFHAPVWMWFQISFPLFFLGQILLVSSHWKHSAGNDRIYPAYLVPVWRDNCSRFAQILPGLIWSQLPPGFPLTSVPSGPDPGLSCTSPDRVSASIYFRVCGGTWLCCIFFFFDALQPHLTECVKHTLNGNLKTPRPIFISSILVGICDISTHFRIQSKP